MRDALGTKHKRNIRQRFVVASYQRLFGQRFPPGLAASLRLAGLPANRVTHEMVASLISRQRSQQCVTHCSGPSPVTKSIGMVRTRKIGGPGVRRRQGSLSAEVSKLLLEATDNPGSKHYLSGVNAAQLRLESWCLIRPIVSEHHGLGPSFTARSG